MKKFKNKPNECIKANGKEYWISRSVAIVGSLFAKVENTIYILAEKRSDKMDFSGYWCVVCGYLDWDESGWEAVIRETYEETGLDIKKLKKYMVFNNNEAPFFVKTKIDENKQNVSLNYTMCFDFGKEKHNDMKQAEKFKNSEIEEIKWIPLSEIDHYKWAFEHNERINSAKEFIQNLEIDFFTKKPRIREPWEF